MMLAYCFDFIKKNRGGDTIDAQPETPLHILVRFSVVAPTTHNLSRKKTPAIGG